jgi:Zn-dependent protease
MMTDHERPNDGEFTSTGDWKCLPPRADNPMSWSLPLFRLFGIDVRIHILFLGVVLIELGRAALAGREPGGGVPLGLAWTGIGLGMLFIVVLIHELAHCLAARRLGGSAPEILLWPLGGLAAPVPPTRWRAHLVTALAGLLVTLVVFVLLGSVLWFETGSLEVAFPNIFSAQGILGGILVTSGSWWLTLLFVTHWMNTILLLVNLLPILPFDGARVLQALLWRGRGYGPAMSLTERIGGYGAVALGLVAILFAGGVWTAYLIAIAFFCGVLCYGARRRREFTDQELGMACDEGWTPVEGDSEVVGRIGVSEQSAEDSPPRRSGPANEEIDALLDKIRVSGLSSLTRSERRVLKKATRQRRRDQ